MDEYEESWRLDDWVDVVVLRASDNSRLVPAAGTLPVDLAAGKAPEPELLYELLDSTVRVTASEGTLSMVLDTLRAIAVPAAFDASPWLAGSRPVVVRDGTGVVGDLSVSYSDGTGLRITELSTNLDDDQDG